MAINNFAANTVGITSQQSACQERPFGLTGTGLDTVPFLMAVLDSLARLYPTPTIPNIPMCDAVQAYRDMTCSLINKSLPGNLDEQALMAQIAYKLNLVLT